MIGWWVWRKRSRSVGLREESLNEYLHWLSLKFSKLVFPSKLVLPMLLRECVLWRNEIEKPVFLPALLWNGGVGLVFLVRKATFIISVNGGQWDR